MWSGRAVGDRMRLGNKREGGSGVNPVHWRERTWRLKHISHIKRTLKNLLTRRASLLFCFPNILTLQHSHKLITFTPRIGTGWCVLYPLIEKGEQRVVSQFRSQNHQRTQRMTTCSSEELKARLHFVWSSGE